MVTGGGLRERLDWTQAQSVCRSVHQKAQVRLASVEGCSARDCVSFYWTRSWKPWASIVLGFV